MKTKQKHVLTTIAVAIVFYAIGAYWGFPFAQLGLTSGNIGHASKQQEMMSSPADVKLVEKFETDTAYRNKMMAGYGLLYAQTKATMATIKSLKEKVGAVSELKNYAGPMNDVLEVGGQLLPMLEGSINGLKDVKSGKPVSDLNVQMSQALNLFQIMNSCISYLESFSIKTEQLSKQKKINDDVLKLYNEYLVESSDVAMSCGDYTRASQNLGLALKNLGTAESQQICLKVKIAYKTNISSLNMGISKEVLNTVAHEKTIDMASKIKDGQMNQAKEGRFQTMDRVAGLQSAGLIGMLSNGNNF